MVYVEFDWLITSATITSTNALFTYLFGSQSQNVNSSTATDVYVDDILGLYITSNDGKVHCWNKDIGYIGSMDSVPAFFGRVNIPI